MNDTALKINQTSHRLRNIDFLKGIGILLMIISHSGFASATGIDIYINAFYMPMFFLISGYFLHTEKYTFSSYFVGKFKNLILPYVIWSSFHLILWLLMWKYKLISVSETPVTMICGVLLNNNVHLPIAGALWFLSCLFLVSMFSFIAVKKGHIKSYLFFTVCLGFIGLFFHPFIPWSGDTGLAANIFFAVGYVLQVNQNKLKETFSYCNGFVLVLVMISFHALAHINGFTNIRECNYGHYPLLYVVIALLGIIMWLLFSNFLYRCKFLLPCLRTIEWIGVHSMSFLCLNQLVLAITSRIFHEGKISQLIQTGIVVIVITVFTFFILNADKKYKTKIYNIIFGR